jgi:oxaloacetate decarboxylase gamma subunit
MIIEGFKLMVVGMLVVYVFLTMLLWSIKAMGAILPEELPPVPKKKAVKKKAAGGMQPEIVAAISAAISAYRRDHK